MARIRTVAAALAMFAAYAGGQTRPAFEVVSIHASQVPSETDIREGRLHVGMKIDKARLDFGAVSVKQLIMFAYGVKEFQVDGLGPPDSGPFDILAKLPEGSTLEQVPAMMQTLLAEKFGLVVRHGTKEFAVYALVVDKGGPKLKAAGDSQPNGRERAMTMDNLTIFLAPPLVDRPTIDETRLKGEYLVSIDAFRRVADRVRFGGTAAGEAMEPTGGSIMSILRGYGLRLEARKMNLPVIVVEHVERAPVE